jgi:hypothetical protein
MPGQAVATSLDIKTRIGQARLARRPRHLDKRRPKRTPDVARRPGGRVARCPNTGVAA